MKIKFFRSITFKLKIIIKIDFMKIMFMVHYAVLTQFFFDLLLFKKYSHDKSCFFIYFYLLLLKIQIKTI